jgi:hypothetical protein
MMKRNTRRLGRELASLLVVALWAWVGAPAPAGAFDCIAGEARIAFMEDPGGDPDNDGFTNEQECDERLLQIYVAPGPTGEPNCVDQLGNERTCTNFSLVGGPFKPDLFVNFFLQGTGEVCSLFPEATSLLSITGSDPLAVLSDGLGFTVYRDVVDPDPQLFRRVGPASGQRLLRLIESVSDGPIDEFGSIVHGFVNDAGDGVINTGTICRFVLDKCASDASCDNIATSTDDTREEIVLAQIANSVAHECGHGCPKLTRKVSRKNGPHEGAGSGRVMEKFIDVSCSGKRNQPRTCDFGISTLFSDTDLNDATLVDPTADSAAP